MSVLGRVGLNYPVEQQNSNWIQIKQNAEQLLQRLKTFNHEQIVEFLDFQTLNELLSKTSSISASEIDFFIQAFKVLIEEKFALETMAPCWRACL